MKFNELIEKRIVIIGKRKDVLKLKYPMVKNIDAEVIGMNKQELLANFPKIPEKNLDSIVKLNAKVSMFDEEILEIKLKMANHVKSGLSCVMLRLKEAMKYLGYDTEHLNSFIRQSFYIREEDIHKDILKMKERWIFLIRNLPLPQIYAIICYVANDKGHSENIGYIKYIKITNNELKEQILDEIMRYFRKNTPSTGLLFVNFKTVFNGYISWNMLFDKHWFRYNSGHHAILIWNKKHDSFDSLMAHQTGYINDICLEEFNNVKKITEFNYSFNQEELDNITFYVKDFLLAEHYLTNISMDNDRFLILTFEKTVDDNGVPLVTKQDVRTGIQLRC